MTKEQLLEQIAHAAPDARVCFADAKGILHDVEEVIVRSDTTLTHDEIQLFRARAA
jgi:hypothetical protein